MLRKIRIVAWIAVAAALAAIAVLRLMPAPPPAAETQAAFRPEFALPDATGTMRRIADYRGKYLLVFFGFTNCPDVCPTTMAEVATVMDDLGPRADEVLPIFISIDPVRDIRLGLGDYLAAFHSSIIGLAGDESATKAAADSFRIHFSREVDAAATDGYSMSHSPSLYLIGPDGDWLRQFTYGTPAEDILKDLEERI